MSDTKMLHRKFKFKFISVLTVLITGYSCDRTIY